MWKIEIDFNNPNIGKVCALHGPDFVRMLLIEGIIYPVRYKPGEGVGYIRNTFRDGGCSNFVCNPDHWNKVDVLKFVRSHYADDKQTMTLADALREFGYTVV